MNQEVRAYCHFVKACGEKGEGGWASEQEQEEESRVDCDRVAHHVLSVCRREVVSE